ncbi:hypothetical protein P7C71_g5590, partial [Lecanoromycetidae sp. Uapishka_2]
MPKTVEKRKAGVSFFNPNWKPSQSSKQGKQSPSSSSAASTQPLKPTTNATEDNVAPPPQQPLPPAPQESNDAEASQAQTPPPATQDEQDESALAINAQMDKLETEDSDNDDAAEPTGQGHQDHSQNPPRNTGTPFIPQQQAPTTVAASNPPRNSGIPFIPQPQQAPTTVAASNPPRNRVIPFIPQAQQTTTTTTPAQVQAAPAQAAEDVEMEDAPELDVDAMDCTEDEAYWGTDDEGDSVMSDE